MRLPRTEVRNVLVAGGVLAVAPIPILGGSYYEGVLAHILVIALLAVGLNIVFGHTDQLFLFTGGLAGLGAYGTALMADWFGVPALLTYPLAALLAGVIGLVVSWVSAKRNLTVILIAILTFSLQLVFIEVFIGARDITRGSTGFAFDYFSLATVADATGLGTKVVAYYAMLLLLVLALLFYVWLVHSRFGVAFDALREDELAAESIGIDVVRNKTLAGFIGAFLIGLVGPLSAAEAGYLLPSDFAFLRVDVLVLIVLVLGGIRTTLGPVVGAVIVVVIEEVLATVASEWQTAIFGALLILLFLYFREGVVVSARDWLAEFGLGGDDGSGGEPVETGGG